MALHEHVPHPHIAHRQKQGPIRAADKHVGFNGRVALLITAALGSMICAYSFCVLAVIALPAALHTHNPLIIVTWISQTFFQLVFLPVLLVGQNIQGKASDERAQQTFDDAEAVLHTCLQIEEHLQKQDVVLMARSGQKAEKEC